MPRSRSLVESNKLYKKNIKKYKKNYKNPLLFNLTAYIMLLNLRGSGQTEPASKAQPKNILNKSVGEIKT